MKITVTKIRRDVGGSAYTRGLSLLVFVLAGSIFVGAQTPAELTPENAARLRRQIETGSVEEKRTALFDIRNLQSAAASAIAVPALTDINVLVRSTAASSVVYLSKPEAVRVLLPLLADRDEFVRREGAHALGDVADRSTTTALVRLMERDKVLEVRTSAAWSLGRIGDPAAVASLTAILRSKPVEDEEFLRRNAARSIGQIAQIGLIGESAVVTPENFLPEKFKELGPPSFQTPMDKSRDIASAVDVLIAVLRSKSESDDTRREAAYALGWTSDNRALPVLQSFVSSPDSYLVEIVREAMLRIENRTRPRKSQE